MEYACRRRAKFQTTNSIGHTKGETRHLMQCPVRTCSEDASDQGAGGACIIAASRVITNPCRRAGEVETLLALSHGGDHPSSSGQLTHPAAECTLGLSRRRGADA